MHYHIDAEMYTKRFNSALKVRIIGGNNKTLLTTIPLKNGKTVSFDKDEELKISYYHGEFIYSFSLVYNEKVESNGDYFYEFLIEDVVIDNNYRKSKRDIVEFKGLIMNTREILYVNVLDVSSTGLKFETETPLDKRKVEIHYSNEDNKTIKVKGKIVWSKKISDSHYQYEVGS